MRVETEDKEQPGTTPELSHEYQAVVRGEKEDKEQYRTTKGSSYEEQIMRNKTSS